jgi:hypothetical protein
MRMVKTARLNMAATYVAQTAMERTFNKTFSEIKDETTTTTIVSVVNGVQNATTFTTVLKVTPISSTFVDVIVTVSWHDGLDRTLTLEGQVVDKS